VAHPSAALVEFDAALSSAQRLSRIEARYLDPPHSGTAPTVQALRGGFCVLVVGSFEKFLSDAFAEHLARLEGSPPPVTFADLPEKLRLSSVFASLERAMKGPRHGAPSKQAGRYPDVLAASRRVVSGNIDPQALAQTGGNPDAGRVTQMFVAIGVADPFSATRPHFDALWGKPEASTFVPDKLDEILNARHRVAHTANALAVTRGHLLEWPRFLQVLATVLDKRLDDYATNVVAGTSAP